MVDDGGERVRGVGRGGRRGRARGEEGGDDDDDDDGKDADGGEADADADDYDDEGEEKGSEYPLASSTSSRQPTDVGFCRRVVQNTTITNTTSSTTSSTPQQLPTPPTEQRPDQGVTSVALQKQRRQRYWICCACGEGRNRAGETGCRVGICAHERGGCCGGEWEG